VTAVSVLPERWASSLASVSTCLSRLIVVRTHQSIQLCHQYVTCKVGLYICLMLAKRAARNGCHVLMENLLKTLLCRQPSAIMPINTRRIHAQER
jgi:hypothetical protein